MVNCAQYLNRFLMYTLYKMSLEEDVMDPEIYLFSDVLLSIDNQEKAEAYVDQIRNASAQQLEAIIKALYQVTAATIATLQQDMLN